MTDRRMGMWYEELTVGTVVSHAITRTLTETDNVLFTTMSMNPQPLHLDADFAAKTQFGRPLVNSLFTLALTVGISVPIVTMILPPRPKKPLRSGFVASRIRESSWRRSSRATRSTWRPR